MKGYTNDPHGRAYAAATIRKEKAIANDLLSYFTRKRLEVNGKNIYQFLDEKKGLENSTYNVYLTSIMRMLKKSKRGEWNCIKLAFKN